VWRSSPEHGSSRTGLASPWISRWLACIKKRELISAEKYKVRSRLDFVRDPFRKHLSRSVRPEKSVDGAIYKKRKGVAKLEDIFEERISFLNSKQKGRRPCRDS
jgi:hypothetical protein